MEFSPASAQSLSLNVELATSASIALLKIDALKFTQARPDMLTCVWTMGVRVGLGVGIGDGLGVGTRVGVGVGAAVGVAVVGFGVGAGVGPDVGSDDGDDCAQRREQV